MGRYGRNGFNRRLGYRRVRPRQARLYRRILPHNQRVTGGPSTAGQSRNATRMFLDSCSAIEQSGSAAGSTIINLNTSFPKITLFGSDLRGIGAAANHTGLLTVAAKYQRYMVTGYKVWWRFCNQAVETVNAMALYFVYIPTNKFDLNVFLALSTEAEKTDFLMCHAYARKVLLPSGAIAQTKAVSLYMSRARSLAVDRFEDLGDDESGTHFSGGLSINNAGTTPIVTDTVPASYNDSTMVTAASNNTVALLDSEPWYCFLCPMVSGSARPHVSIQARLRKYVLFYDPIPPTKQDYTYTTEA